jgi:hypothetical protein
MKASASPAVVSLPAAEQSKRQEAELVSYTQHMTTLLWGEAALSIAILASAGVMQVLAGAFFS